jgi:hypothetical protein
MDSTKSPSFKSEALRMIARRALYYGSLFELPRIAIVQWPPAEGSKVFKKFSLWDYKYILFTNYEDHLSLGFLTNWEMDSEKATRGVTLTIARLIGKKNLSIEPDSIKIFSEENVKDFRVNIEWDRSDTEISGSFDNNWDNALYSIDVLSRTLVSHRYFQAHYKDIKPTIENHIYRDAVVLFSMYSNFLSARSKTPFTLENSMDSTESHCVLRSCLPSREKITEFAKFMLE